MKAALVLLSGGMDSAVSLLYACKGYDHVDAITYDYGQVARYAELKASEQIWDIAMQMYQARLGPRLPVSKHTIVQLPDSMFASASSILGRSEINEYATVAEAVQNTPNDRSYIPLRNAIFITIAAHHLLARFPSGGDIVIGTRSRSDPGAPAGYPDCTSEFAHVMSRALSQGSDKPVTVFDPLNHRPVPSREDTIRYAMDMDSLGLQFIARSVTCFTGTRCGKCLPCQRRKQAFEAIGIADPAIDYYFPESKDRDE